MSAITLMVDIDVDLIAQDLAENHPERVLIELIKLIDANMADPRFTFKLIEALDEGLSTYGYVTAIGTIKEIDE